MHQESCYCVLPPSLRHSIRVATARGSWLTDHTGRDYLDFIQGYAVNTLGHAPDAIHSSLKKQAKRLLYGTHGFRNEPMLDLAKKLARLSGLGRIAFSGSGEEANNNAVQLALHWGRTRGANQIVTTRKDFGTHADPSSNAVKVPFNDLAAVATALARRTVAVIVESIDSESGLLPSPAYLSGLRKLTEEHGILLIMDETRCGIGRTGQLFAFQDSGIKPDTLTLACGLGGGLPLAATLVRQEFSSVLGESALSGSGHSLSMSATITVLDTLCTPGFLDAVIATGHYLENGLEHLARCHPELGRVQGKGLMQTIEVRDGSAVQLAEAALKEGLLVDAPRADLLRLMPALNVTLAEIDEMLVRLACALNRGKAAGK